MKWILVIGAVLLVFIFWAAWEDEQSWERYKIDHHCKPIGRVNGSTDTGYRIGPNGQVIPTTNYHPPKTIYMCDGNDMEIR